MKIDKTVGVFFTLFLTVYFLESIGGFYMTSAIVSIEKQFQIPSKISGLMVSAGDFGYIPSVVFVSYFGSKGNRAKWIGAGSILISIANVAISSSNFLFPIETGSLNTQILENSLERDLHRLSKNITFRSFLNEISAYQQELVYKRLNEQHPILPTIDENSMWWFLSSCEGDAFGANDEACKVFYEFLNRHNAPTRHEIEQRRNLTSTSGTFCSKTINELRKMFQRFRCSTKLSNVGPTITIFIGLFILGIGRTMPFSLGLPLIDDNVKKSNLPLYFAFMFFIRIMGPLVGFQMGAYFNKRYYTSNVPHGITPLDPMWIGQWWGGFLAIGSVLFLPSLALFLFPAPKFTDDEKKSDKGEKNKNDRSKLALVDRHLERSADGNGVVPDGINAKVKDFVETISTVMKQPVYRWAMAGRIIDVFAFKGFHIFLPKYIEINFGIPQYKVNQLLGIVGVVSFAIGIVFGSVIVKFFRLQGRRAATLVAITGAISASFCFINANVGCKSTMTSLGESLQVRANKTDSCLIGCSCESASLYPVCDLTGKVFYSPCHAGCQVPMSSQVQDRPLSAQSADQASVFEACGCASSYKTSRKFCDNGDCESKLYIYFAISALGGIIAGLGVIPGILIMLRSVPPKHRSISLGFNGLLVSLFATLPSPIVWGTLIDKFCISWQEKCGEKGACSLYDTDNLRIWLHYTYGILRFISLIADIYVIKNAKNLKLLEPDEDIHKQTSNEQENLLDGDKNGPEKFPEQGEGRKNSSDLSRIQNDPESFNIGILYKKEDFSNYLPGPTSEV